MARKKIENVLTELKSIHQRDEIIKKLKAKNKKQRETARELHKALITERETNTRYNNFIEDQQSEIIGHKDHIERLKSTTEHLKKESYDHMTRGLDCDEEIHDLKAVIIGLVKKLN